MIERVLNSHIRQGVFILCLLLHLVTPQSLNRTQRRLRTVPIDISDNWISIHLSDNLITRIEDNAFANLTKLKEIWLGTNQITYVSATAFQNTDIIILGLSYNQLATVPDFSVYGGSIGRLYLGGNNIVSIPDGTFDGMSNLE